MQQLITNNGFRKAAPLLIESAFTGETLLAPSAGEKEINKELYEMEHLRMTTSKEVPALIPIIRIGQSNTSTAGNITTISGEGKSGKTAFLGALMAGAITQIESYDGFKDLNVMSNKNRLAVVHFETEQSESRHHANHKTIVHRAGLEHTPDYFFSYNIRRNPIVDYQNLVGTACRGARVKCGGVFLIVIDGVGDFIGDVNNATEANAHVKWLEEMSIEFNCPVVVVVHVNPGSEKERGHLGSQLQRKCESLLIVKRKDDVSTVEAKLLRNAGIGDTPQIQFIYDRMKGYHVSCDADMEMKANTKDLLRFAEIRDFAEMVFKNNTPLSYTDTIEQIMRVSKKSISIAKNMFKEMKAHTIIIQGKSKRWMLNLPPV